MNVFRKGSIVTIDNKMQRGYRFELVVGIGRLPSHFNPELTPKQMLEMGVFEGHYCTDCLDEYPSSWFKNAKMNPNEPDIACNYFKVKSRTPLSEWKNKGWINPIDPRGWFEWYMRFYLGRRISEYDELQIRRWKNFERHRSQVLYNCKSMDLQCRPRQRQALLQWAYNPIF